ncbi:MAG: hypothetical protein IKB19_02355 [Rikenellaceae bacterium]|nr:hypothetical protein [Rikenellaceae bacterium]
MRNKRSRTLYGFLVAHCRGAQGKDAVKRSGCVNPVQSTITLFCYCRADAVKDERSEVNHIVSNACALSAEVPKGKALSGAM